MTEKRTHQLLIKLNENENVIVKNMRNDGINISQYVRNVLNEYSKNMTNNTNEDNIPPSGMLLV